MTTKKTEELFLSASAIKNKSTLPRKKAPRRISKPERRLQRRARTSTRMSDQLREIAASRESSRKVTGATKRRTRRKNYLDKVNQERQQRAWHQQTEDLRNTPGITVTDVVVEEA